jgi:hypothetical protein
MTTTTDLAVAASTTQTTDEFLELVCADEQLLRAEFDAIIAAQWPGSEPGPPDDRGPAPVGRGPGGRSDGPSRPGGRERIRPDSRPRHPGADEWARQRSPP